MTTNFDFPDIFLRRHLGPTRADITEMLETVGFDSLDALTEAAIPEDIRLRKPLDLPPATSEFEVIRELRAMAEENQVWRSYIGMGYSNTITPPVIQRNVLENPGWYTQYTPYQAEISQGRLEALLNFQTMITDLTGMKIANSSVLDEGTGAAEAMSLCLAVNRKNKSETFFVSELCHPQTIEVVKTRAQPLGLEVIVGDHKAFDFSTKVFGCLLAYPATDGTIHDYRAFAEKAHAENALVVVAADLLSLALLTPPGEWGADVVVGNSQRFGVPFGYGGPHAGFFATSDAYKRQLPGRIIGISKDAQGNPALRLALQTREQHIRREKATSNICTAQVLLAIMASMYAVYHGPKGIRAIAQRVRDLTATLADGLRKLGHGLGDHPVFDTLRVTVDAGRRKTVLDKLAAKQINVREFDNGDLGVSLDEAVTVADLDDVLEAFGADFRTRDVATFGNQYVKPFARTSDYLTHPIFNQHRSEHAMLRYLKKLETKDLSLTESMIPLGSCTMKLNATTEMLPVTWPEFGAIHPFAPVEQAQGYQKMFRSLEAMLNEITGFAATSLQPNAGSQGEYSGMLVIKAYHESRGEGHRNVCIIPTSAHGTNPASAVMAGMKVVPVKCDDQGNIDLDDLKVKTEKHTNDLAAIMVTYPSTHGVFEEKIARICEFVHEHGGQVYLDGANLNAQCGLCRPGDYGADVCHINLHKTFCIPHGGGGPGMGPIAVAAHLAPFLPKHPVIECGGEQGIGAVAAAPWGSSSILPISWVYIRLLGAEGLKRATQVAVLAANYMAKRIDPYFPVLYHGFHSLNAHEFIIDLRNLKATSGVEAVDIAKRLMDYGFHAPTLSFPVIGTMMIEPTESEPKEEMDRLCDAMIAIHGEIGDIAAGKVGRENNLLKNAPHTAKALTEMEWDRPYTRAEACFPTDATRAHKYWTPVGRIDDAYGDRNLMCTCVGMDAFEE